MYSIDKLYPENECLPGRHLESDFCQPVKFLREIQARWPPGQYQFPVIFMDWFFEVQGYSVANLKENFIKKVIPKLAELYKVEAVWLPWTQRIMEFWCEEGTSEACEAVGLHAVAVEDAPSNPLYAVTVGCQSIFNHDVPPRNKKWADAELTKALPDENDFMYWLCLQKFDDPQTIYGVDLSTCRDI